MYHVVTQLCIAASEFQKSKSSVGMGVLVQPGIDDEEYLEEGLQLDDMSELMHNPT